MEKNRLKDQLSKNDGSGYVTINGNIEAGFQVDKLEISIEMISESKQLLNQRIEQTAVRGMKINGNISFYASTNALVKAIEKYKNGGRYPDITIQGWATINETERCEILITDVIINKLTLLALEAGSSDSRIYDSDITANDYQLI